MTKVIRVGDTMMKDNKPVTVIASIGNDEYVCRFVEDARGNIPNRCYIYHKDRLNKMNLPEVTETHKLALLNGDNLRKVVNYKDCPTIEEIQLEMVVNRATTATVTKVYTLAGY